MVIFGGMRDEAGGTNQIIAWLWVYFYPTILESNILFFSTKAARCVMMRTDFFFFLCGGIFVPLIIDATNRDYFPLPTCLTLLGFVIISHFIALNS